MVIRSWLGYSCQMSRVWRMRIPGTVEVDRGQQQQNSTGLLERGQDIVRIFLAIRYCADAPSRKRRGPVTDPDHSE